MRMEVPPEVNFGNGRSEEPVPVITGLVW